MNIKQMQSFLLFLFLALGQMTVFGHTKLEKAQESLLFLEKAGHEVNHALLKRNTKEERIDYLEKNESALYHFVEENGVLSFWNTSVVNPARIYSNGFYRLSNGWYEIIVDSLDEKFAYTAIPIYQHFNYHNDYLNDEISPLFGISGEWIILSDSISGSESLSSENQSKIYFQKVVKESNGLWSAYCIHLIMAIFFIVLLLLLPEKFRRKWLAIPMVILSIWEIRCLILNNSVLTDFGSLLSFDSNSVLFYICLAAWVVLIHLSIQLFIYTRKSLSFVLFATFMYSIVLALVGESVSTRKEIKERKEHILQHANERDLLIESVLQDIDSLILKDDKVSVLASNPWENQEALTEHFNSNYFASYWSKFQVRATAFYKGDSMLVQPDDQVVACHEYFDQQVNESGEKLSDFLWFIKNVEGISAYLMEFNLGGDLRLALELDSKIDEKGLGFPDLLTDKENQTKPHLSGYSYAKYFEDELIDQFGDYDFHYQLPIAFKSSKDLEEISLDGYSHLVHHHGEGKTMVISKKTNELQSLVTSFSYQFCWLSLILGLFYLIWWLFSKKDKVELDFKSRMQISMVGILMVSLVLVASGTIYYLVEQHDLKNKFAIKEKIKSVQIELEHKLGGETSLGVEDQEYIQYLMIIFSKVFFTDINLFDLNGNLIASSQPKLYNEGLISTKIDPTAFEQVLREHRSSFTHKEHIGELSFLSVYVPFTNDDNQVMAVLNLPYFSQQNVLQNQVNQFLVTIINIYVFLMVLGTILTLFIYQRLTRPIRMIQEQFKTLSLHGGNDLLEWKGNDEFGQLIKAYNKLLLELADSADKLARSEREGAWKEMAKQVAHEIKNPLTPMKLSIQHFEMTADPSSADFKDRLKGMSRNLVEQIDVLSNIASEFSSFAKLPDAKMEEIDLIKTLETTSSLYQNEIDIEFNIGIENIPLKADKDQLTRVFNNLIKNAIQACDNDGKLTISIDKLDFDQGKVVVTFKDNGHGIDDETSKKIFVPNFTTKNSGSGLGLAMVKSILEQMGASIAFESEVGVGTTFKIEF
jgi:two-component system, NtrC family, nitrogen regulation sensor histidine kinase NtrY